jgi:hypothetical protein
MKETQKKTDWVLQYISKTELENCINLFKDGDIFDAVRTLQYSLQPVAGLLALEDAVRLMKELVKEATNQNQK